MQNIRKGALALLLSCVSLPLAGQIQGTETPSASNPRPAFGPQPVPAPPPTLEQQPASAPWVAFQGGQLTIVARNASLGAILREVESQTGATVDMPANPTDRVVGQFGPGPAREVLASLLNGSRFNYVLMGSPQDPTSLDKIVLLRKPSGTDQPGAGGASQGTNTAQMMVPRQGAIVIPNQDDDANAQDNAEETMEADPPAEDQASQGDEQQGASGQPAVKTPQQLLQELQQQQQLQQQQGQQGGPPGTPPPQQIQNRLQQ